MGKNDIRQIVFDKYGSREQLIQQGIWRGEIYSNRLLNDSSRGWLWKTIVLHGDVIDEVNDSTFNDQMIANSLVPVPIITRDNENVPIVDNAEDITVLKKKTKGIRRLTPMQVDEHPLHINNNDYEAGNERNEQNTQKRANAEDDEGITMTLSDTLDIIDLDLSRLLLDPIFQENKIHLQLRQILYNYMLILQKNDDNNNNTIVKINKNYQQGFHELLGLIYLQLYNDSTKKNEITMMNNVLNIYIKLMRQIVPTFYTRSALLNWESSKFEPILKICSSKLYEKLYLTNNSFSNLIWLIRWTRLIFIRELPMDYVLIIWDHILTFQYPIDTFIICLVVTLLLNIFEDLVKEFDEDDEADELIEKLLHFKTAAGTKLISCVEICKIAGNLCELYSCENFEDMKCICDTFVRVRIGHEKFEKLNTLKDTSNNKNSKNSTIDPNRKRLEILLKARVKKLTTSFKR